jgi:lipoprotein NlpD
LAQEIPTIDFAGQHGRKLFRFALARVGLWIVLLGVLSACASQAARAPVGDRSARPARNPDFHTVRQGDTLYSVAFMYGYEVGQVARWNGLKSPYTIYKGQRLRLRPLTTRRAAPPASRPKTTYASRATVRPSQPKSRPVAPSRPKTPVTTARPAPVATAAPPAPRSAPVKRDTGPPKWIWPAPGPLLRGYSVSGNGKKGIEIGGKSGQSVHAAAAGKVVYSGSGLAGYGRLIIIKHNNDFLSAYAHNRKLIAREGEWVKRNQVIAQMGSSGTDRVQLHFEIRERGRPVDPLKYLPGR